MEESKPNDEAAQALADLFDEMAQPCKSGGRTYLLELVDNQPVFRREEIDLAIKEVMSAFGGKADIAEIRSGLDSHLGQNRRFFSGNVCDPLRAASSCMPSASHSNSAGSKRTAWSRVQTTLVASPRNQRESPPGQRLSGPCMHETGPEYLPSVIPPNVNEIKAFPLCAILRRYWCCRLDHRL